MTFSVIVPFLNEEKYLRDCVNSLLAQDFSKDEYELIFVDNGSTDNSRSIVSKHKEIILLTEERKNVYIARNKALKAARGDIIAFTDADCSVCPDWLSQIYKGMNTANATIALGKVFLGRNPSLCLRIIQDYRNAIIEYLLANHHQVLLWLYQ